VPSRYVPAVTALRQRAGQTCALADMGPAERDKMEFLVFDTVLQQIKV